MSALIQDLQTASPESTGCVFDAQGLPVSRFSYPSLTIDPAHYYGSITEGYAADIREKLRPLLHHTGLAIQFSKVTEGRPYSLALRLREMGFLGELHAVGAINREVVHHLIRVGFTHFHLPDRSPFIAKEIVAPFSFFYQRV